MASAGKKKTTMAKLTRENRVRERRVLKQARKLARKNAAMHAPDDPETGAQAAAAVAPEPGPPEPADAQAQRAVADEAGGPASDQG